MSDDEKAVKTTSIEGVLTGDHECGLLFPEDRIPSIREASKNGLYLQDLIPEEAQDGKHKFTIRVEAEPIPYSPESVE